MSLLFPVPAFSSMPSHLHYTHVTSISSACILINALASTLCAHRAKTPNLVNHANNYLTRASLQKDEKRGESPDEKVLNVVVKKQKNKQTKKQENASKPQYIITYHRLAEHTLQHHAENSERCKREECLHR